MNTLQARSVSDAHRAGVEDHPHSRPHASRTGIVVLVLLGGLAKVSAYRSLIHHPAILPVAVGMGGVVSLLRGRPTGTAVAAAVIVPVAIAPGSFLVGVALGIGTLIALMTLFIAIGTLLRLADRP